MNIDEQLIEKGADAYRYGKSDDGSDADDAVNRDVARVLAAVLPEYRAQVLREAAEAMRAKQKQANNERDWGAAIGFDEGAYLLDDMAESSLPRSSE